MSLVGGHSNKAVRVRDRHKLYREACKQISDLGWHEAEVFEVWEWLAGCREFEMSIPRAYAEHLALQDVWSIFDIRGRAPS